MEYIIEIRGLDVSFDMHRMQVAALQEVDLDLHKGEVLGVLGESGSGKTVLLTAALRLLPENARITGQILYCGNDLLSMDRNRAMRLIGKKFSLIPQGFGSLNPFLKSWLQISERPMEHLRIGKKESYRMAENLLRDMGLDSPARAANSYRHQLSGGMLQRVLVAMGISGHSEAIFVDEPTKGLDERKKQLVVELLQLAKKKTGAMMIVSHDLAFLKKISDRVCVMYCGEVIETSKARNFFTSPKHPYSYALLESLPSKGLKPIEGEIPSMVSPPKGCRFNPRCNYSFRRCREERPPLAEIDGVMVRCFKYV
uniref:Nickel import system ATP-binding protein NikD n=1 Tax=Candidatus Methanomethylicus mesodigestus TaxID=1867258 RepID=A0A7C3J4V1_9CREN